MDLQKILELKNTQIKKVFQLIEKLEPVLIHEQQHLEI